MQHSLIRPASAPVLAAGIALAFMAGLAGCTSSPESPAPQTAARNQPPASALQAQPSEPEGTGPLVVFLGDSLTAGYGLAAEEAYPARVAAALRAKQIEARVLNAGVSGDTTAGGLSRLDWLLAQKPKIVVIALGGNDGLRGLPVEMSEENLREMIRKCRDASASVLLAGMMMPPSYGPEYTEAFRAMYPALAKETGVALMPFLLEGVAADPALNQEDGIHPNAKGQAIVAEHVLPYIEELLGSKKP